jgi:hypothetical protein
MWEFCYNIRMTDNKLRDCYIVRHPLPFCRTNRHCQANFVWHGVLRKEKQTFLQHIYFSRKSSQRQFKGRDSITNEKYFLKVPTNRIISFSISTDGFLNFWLAFLEKKKQFRLSSLKSLTISENQPRNPPVIMKVPTMTCTIVQYSYTDENLPR